ncbi:MAG: Jag N-terminal domain-containing protein [Candidatus Omnitrophica bacterium]|nr:Jag N-terminal domain-containing protein [Candidatus Omnitrophota bacterium]
MECKIGESIESEGRSTREAITTALKKLGVPKDRVRVQVLSEERKGLFGMKGASQAKVRITVIK